MSLPLLYELSWDGPRIPGTPGKANAKAKRSFSGLAPPSALHQPNAVHPTNMATSPTPYYPSAAREQADSAL